MMPMWGMPLGTGAWWLFSGLWMLVFWGGLIALIIWGVTALTRTRTPHEKANPLELAKERYARGEITRTDFEQIKKDLS